MDRGSLRTQPTSDPPSREDLLAHEEQARPRVNMLRGTVAVISASVWGADTVSALPFTSALGLPNAFARHVAHNAQSILFNEAHLWRVSGPASGSGGGRPWGTQRPRAGPVRHANPARRFRLASIRSWPIPGIDLRLLRGPAPTRQLVVRGTRTSPGPSGPAGRPRVRGKRDKRRREASGLS